MMETLIKWSSRWYAAPVLLFAVSFLAASFAEIALSLSRRGSVKVIDVLGAGLLGGAFGGGGGLFGAGLFAIWQRKNSQTNFCTSVSADGARQENGGS